MSTIYYTYMNKIKEVKRNILGEYYNMFNCNKTKEEIRELYELYNLKNKLGITVSELYYITHCKYTEEEYLNIKLIDNFSHKTLKFLLNRQNSLDYPYTNIARIYYLPNYPVYTMIKHLKRMIKNAINVEIVFGKGGKHAAITFKNQEQVMNFVLNNSTINYGNRFCVIAFGYPEKEVKGEEKVIEEGYKTAVSCYNFLEI